MMKRVIGIDFGTTTICAGVLDGEKGEWIDVRTIPNRHEVTSEHSWEKIQDAAGILQDGLDLVNKLRSAHGPIIGIGLTGQMHGIVYINEEGSPVSPLYTWQDGRGDREMENTGKSYAEFITENSGYSVASGYGTVTHFYNQVNRLIPKDAVKLTTIYDAFRIFLLMNRSGIPCCSNSSDLYKKDSLSAATSQIIPSQGSSFEPSNLCLHPSSAASFGLYHLDTVDFDREIIRELGMDPDFFPSVSKENRPSENPDGIFIFPGIGDNQASFAGSVNIPEKALLINVGTGSQISFWTDEPVHTPGSEIRPYINNDYLWVGSSLCGGRAFSMLEKFFRAAADEAGAPPGSMYPWMNRLSEQVFTMDNPVTVKPYFSGTRENPSLKGSIEKLGTDNFTPAHLIAGVLQGTVDELYEMYFDIREKRKNAPSFLIGSGNGIRKSPVVRKLFEQKFGIPLYMPNHREEAAFGAALFALSGDGSLTNLREVQQLIHFDEEKQNL